MVNNRLPRQGKLGEAIGSRSLGGKGREGKGREGKGRFKGHWTEQGNLVMVVMLLPCIAMILSLCASPFTDYSDE